MILAEHVFAAHHVFFALPNFLYLSHTILTQYIFFRGKSLCSIIFQLLLLVSVRVSFVSKAV